MPFNNRQLSHTGRPAILRPNIVPACGALHKTPIGWRAGLLRRFARANTSRCAESDQHTRFVARMSEAISGTTLTPPRHSSGLQDKSIVIASAAKSPRARKDGLLRCARNEVEMPLRTRTREHHDLTCTTQSPLSPQIENAFTPHVAAPPSK